MPVYDEFFPFNKGFGSPANSLRWQKMGKIFVADGIVEAVDYQFGNVAHPTTYAGTTVTLQSGAVWHQGYYGELLLSAPAALTVPNPPTGTIMSHLNLATSSMEIAYFDGTAPVNTATDFYLPIWKLVAGVFTDQRVLVGPTPPGALAAQPPIPASGVAVVNCPTVGTVSGTTYSGAGYDCDVYIKGGTVTAITIGGTITGLITGTFKVKAGQSISLTYSVAPTWVWFGG